MTNIAENSQVQHRPIKFIEVEGDAHERGVQIGKATRQQIAHSLSVYRQMFALCDISWQQAIEKSSQYHDLVQSSFPTLMDELKGIAIGSGADIEDLFALNCRTEILPPDFLARALADVDLAIADQANPEHANPDQPCTASNEHINECTSFAFNRSTNKPVWLSQNWDWVGLQRQALVVVRAKTEYASQFITVTEAGMLAKIGLNQHGFGMCLNILRSVDDGKQIGLPVHIFLRALLDCDSVNQAKALVEENQFASSSNVMIADKSGQMVSFELSPNGSQILNAVDHSLCHTNHFLHAALIENDAAQAGNLSTLHRLDTARKRLPTVQDLDGIKSLLSDTSNGLESICRFADTNLPPIAQIETVVGVVMNLSSMELWVSDAQPSVTEFRHYAF